MERFRKISSVIFVFSLLCLSFVNCSSSKAYTIQYEPTLEQLVSETEEICLNRRLFIFSARPCLILRGEKDNASSVIQYYLRYEIGSFDVDLPLGISMKFGDVWHNLKKSATNYSDTITVVSLFTNEDLLALTSSSKMELSYTNRAKTENFKLSDSDVSKVKDGFVKIQRLLESEKKMTILKK
ncbi:MAG: hypothetical protein SH817_13085 [Leptospira sp.]|nr:hypothetical protein [Leptospira sp.]